MLKGTLTALVTPFTAQGDVDHRTLSELIDWQIDSGIDGIVLCGTTGEFPTLSFEEKEGIFKAGVLAAKGRVPLIAGTGSFDTREAIQLTQAAQSAGMDAALVITPYCNRPSPEGCYQHYQELSKIGFPLIPYYHPNRTACKLPVSALARISELPHVVAIKEGSGDLDYAAELMQLTSVPFFSGDDTLTLPMMSVGAVGVISIVSNLIPREWKLLTTLLSLDQYDEGREMFYRYFPLAKAMVLEVNPQCVKVALAALGKCFPHMRLPLVAPQEATQQQILSALARVGLLKERVDLSFHGAD